MKKFILVLVLLIAAAVPGVHYFIGTNVEKSFRTEIQEAAEASALSGFNVELVDYQRSLFNATATTRLSIIMPESEEPVAIDLLHHISHTPSVTAQVLATIDTELALSDENRAALAPLFKDQAPLNVNTRIFFDGHQEAIVSSPAATGTLSDNETATIEWQGLQGTAWQSADRSELTFKLNAPGIVIKEADVAAQAPAEEADQALAEAAPLQQLKSMRLSDFQYQADLRKAESGMWHGEASAGLGGVDIAGTDGSGEAFKVYVDNITMHGDQSESDGLVKATAVVKSKVIAVNEFNLTNAVYDVAVENLDANALVAWQSAVSQMMKEQGASADPMAPMLEQLPALVNAKPVLRINDISVDSPMGRFALSMDSRVIGEWNDMLMENPAMLATMVKANLHLSVPKAFVVSSMQDNMRRAVVARQSASGEEVDEAEIEGMVQQMVDQQLVGMQQQGYIEEVDGQLESRLVYEAGAVTINGVDATPLLGTLMQ